MQRALTPTVQTDTSGTSMLKPKKLLFFLFQFSCGQCYSELKHMFVLGEFFNQI